MDKPSNNKPLIGITIGDYNGIGPEVIIKALLDNRILRLMTPVIYGSTKVLSYYKKALKCENFNYLQIKSLTEVNRKHINVINCWQEDIEIEPGLANEKSGEYTHMALERATEDLKSGLIHALVTAPISKVNIQSEDFNFPGHTEYLQQKFEVSEALMLMVSENVKVGVVTGHMPLKEVNNRITKDLITSKLKILNKSLKRDFGVSKPKIAVLGLNPHAGDGGLIGNEEIDIIEPAIKEFKDRGNLVFGPYAADGFFGALQYMKYDAVLAMYHDQGLVPFKTIAFGKGVNFTAGLPFIRTSPDHGTAYPLVCKNIADEGSMREALYLAETIYKSKFQEEMVLDPS